MTWGNLLAISWVSIGLSGVANAQFFGDYNHPEFTVQHDSDWNEQRRQGACVIRAAVDNEVNVELRWDRVRLMTVAGLPGEDKGSVCNAPLQRAGVSNVQVERLEGRGQISMLEQPGPNNDWAAVVRILDRNGGAGTYAYRLTWQWDGTMPQTSQNNRTRRRGGYGRARNNVSTERSCRQALARRLKDEWGAVIVTYPGENRGLGGNATLAGRADIRAGNENRQVDFQCAVNANTNRVDQIYYDFVGNTFPWNPRLSGSETPPRGVDTSFNIIPACQDVIRARVNDNHGSSNVSFRDISRKWWEGNIQRVNGRAQVNVGGQSATIDYNCTARRGGVEWGDYRIVSGSLPN